jgi:tetratricopeptide (TPR) repeat protein
MPILDRARALVKNAVRPDHNPRGGFPLIRPIAAPRTRRALELTALFAVFALASTGCRSGGDGGGAKPAASSGQVASASDKSQAMSRYVDGLRAYHAGDKTAARTAFADATTANPEMIMARSMLGDLYREDKEYAKAAEQYDTLTKLDPYTANNFYRLGVALHLIPQLNQAATAYLKALDLDPKDWKTNMNLGLVYMVLGDKDASLKYARRAAALNPDSAIVNANLGVALEAVNLQSEATAAYRRSLEQDPKRIATYLNLASNLIGQRRANEAIEVMERAIQQEQSAATHTRYGEALAAAGQADKAVAQYQAALALNANYTPALNALGDAYIRQYRSAYQLDEPKRRMALESWNKSLQLRPNQPRVAEMVKQWTR